VTQYFVGEATVVITASRNISLMFPVLSGFIKLYTFYMNRKAQTMYVLCHTYVFNFISHYHSFRLAMGLDFEEIIFRRSGTVYVQTTPSGSPS
jgi:hypothetical protein